MRRHVVAAAGEQKRRGHFLGHSPGKPSTKLKGRRTDVNVMHQAVNARGNSTP